MYTCTSGPYSRIQGFGAVFSFSFSGQRKRVLIVDNQPIFILRHILTVAKLEKEAVHHEHEGWRMCVMVGLLSGGL